MKRPPRIPTWVIAVFSALVLGGAVALFVAGGSKDVPRTKTEASDTSSADDSQLVLPKDDGEESSDARRRGEAGRARIDTPETDDQSDAADAASTALAPLRGRKITLVAADALTPAVRTPKATTKVGTVAVPCAPLTTSTAARTEERAVLDVLTSQLRGAGAVVTRLDDSSGVAPCGPARAAQFERADVTVVVASASTPSARVGVAAARAAGKLTPADIAASTKLVGSLVGTTGLPALPKSEGPLLRLLASFAVVDLPKGGTTAWIVLPAASDEGDTSRRLAAALAGFVAASALPDAPSTAPSPKASTAPQPKTTTPPAAGAPSSTTPTTTTPAEGTGGTDASSDD
ncbi:MAG: hypothetical protein JWN72_1587 [Thermoleophilia bacterium]|nr:hypothetical protein [Thermoleophilia bacterium]